MTWGRTARRGAAAPPRRALATIAVAVGLQAGCAVELAFVPVAAAQDRVDETAWLAPASESHAEGPWGVLFVPRYADAQSALDQRRDDLVRLELALPTMDHDTRARAARRLGQRLEAVRHWQEVIGRSAGAAGLSADHRAEVLRKLDLLAMEAATLDAQREMIGAAPEPVARRERPRDLFAFGRDLVVQRDVRVRDAVVFGGDLEVLGTVERHATAFGGDVRVQRGGDVRGEAHAFGGTVAHLGLTPPTPPSPPTLVLPDPSTGVQTHLASAPLRAMSAVAAWLLPLLMLSGAGVLAVGLVPERVGRITDVLEDRPLSVLFTGLFGTFGVLFASLLFMVTLIGIPVGLLLLSALGLAWLLGFVAVCQAVGDRLPMAWVHQGRWLAFLTGAVLVTLAWSLPWVGALVVALVSFLGVGAALASRLGRPSALG